MSETIEATPKAGQIGANTYIWPQNAESQATSSPTLGKLFEALAKAQGAMKNAPKDSDNPFFKSKYADLGTVMDTLREPLSSNGLCVFHLGVLPSEPGMVAIRTYLGHSSGEFVSGLTEMKLVRDGSPQVVGSLRTYMERYGAKAICGLATEDDDGNTASITNKDIQAKHQVPEPAKVAPRAPQVASKPLFNGTEESCHFCGGPVETYEKRQGGSYRQCVTAHVAFMNGVAAETDKKVLNTLTRDHYYQVVP